ncbi:MAG: HupE/UreJ family protein [Ilumatobacteraceae bacterium]
MTSDLDVRHLSICAMVGATMATVMSATPVFAHTGHGTAGLWDGLAHPVLGIDHVFAMVAVGVLAMTMVRPLAAPAAFLGAMVAGGVLGIAGLSLPGGETAIAISVAALGAALIAGQAMRPAWALGLVGAAGLVHGHAHGAEAPSASHPVVYVAGFVVATASLHLAGVGLGLFARRRSATRTAIGTVLLGAGAGLVVGLL